MWIKSIRNVYHRHPDRFKAKSFLATLAIKMYMLVGNSMADTAVAQFIFKRTAPVLNYMNHIFLGKKFKHPESTSLILRQLQ